MKKTVITVIRIIVIVAILGLLTYGGFVGMNRVSGTGDYTIDQYAATDDGGLLTVTKGGTALHVKCSADQLAVVETQPDGTFHLSFSYSQITNKGTLKDITPRGPTAMHARRSRTRPAGRSRPDAARRSAAARASQRWCSRPCWS